MIEAMGLPPTLIYTITFVFGLMIGSFLNVVIYRLPLQMETSWRRESRDFLGMEPEKEEESTVNIIVPASRCPECGTPLKAHHNIPVFSYIFLQGKCAHCSAPISPQYPIVELLCGLLTVFVIATFGITGTAALVLLFTWALLALTGIDFNTQLLPDNITLPLLWLGLLANTQGLFVPLQEAVIGAVAGYLSLWSIFWIFKLVTGKEGMGHGDFKLLAALGAWLGWQQLPLIILLSSVVGAAIGILAIILLKRDKQVPIPFGPYLAIAGWIALIWGAPLTRQYLELLG